MSIKDSRTKLEDDNADCIWNRCIGMNLTAVCINNKCSESDKYKCPEEKTIGCMPIVPKEKQELCSGPYHEWIAKNCNVTFAL